MNKNIPKLILAVLVLAAIIIISGISVFAYPYPVDTSSDGAQRFENLAPGTSPTDYFKVKQDGTRSTVKVANDLATGNHYLKLSVSNIEGSASEAYIQLEAADFKFGCIELETDFMIENYNSTSIRIGTILSTESNIQNITLIRFETNTKTGQRYIRTTYTKNGTATNVDLQEGYETGVWYHFKALLNPYKGTYTLYLQKHGDANVLTHTVSDATPFPDSGWKVFRANIPGNVVPTSGTTASLCLDNLKLRTVEKIAFSDCTPLVGTENALPSTTISFKLNTVPTAYSLKFNDTPISQTDITIGSDGYYTYTPSVPLGWGTSNTLTGEATDVFGNKCEINIPFTVMAQPDNLIELTGFYDATGKKITSIKDGEIKANIRLWPKNEQAYTCVAGLYKETDGRVKMLAASCGSYTLSSVADKELVITVPSDTTDLFVRLIVFDSFTQRKLFSKDIVYGEDVLK